MHKSNKQEEKMNINYEKRNNIGIISIQRPEALNALNRNIIDEIDMVIEKIKNGDDIRCLIMYSEKNFAAGADIKGMAECNEIEAKRFSFSPTFNKIENLEIPVIAAIEGYALGGGLELALTADIRIAAEDAKMGFPEVSLGIFPGAGGTIRAPRICGEAIAKELIFTGNIITAQRALQIGLINQIYETGKTLDAAISMAECIVKRAPIAIKLVKTVIRDGMEETNKEKAIENEANVWASLFKTYDQKEGMKAFIEKRKPEFKNR